MSIYIPSRKVGIFSIVYLMKLFFLTIGGASITIVGDTGGSGSSSLSDFIFFYERLLLAFFFGIRNSSFAIASKSLCDCSLVTGLLVPGIIRFVGPSYLNSHPHISELLWL